MTMRSPGGEGPRSPPSKTPTEVTLRACAPSGGPGEDDTISVEESGGARRSASVGLEESPRETNGVKRRRKWSEEMDVRLLKEVMAQGAHVSPHGRGQQRYESVITELNKVPIFRCSLDWKGARDRFQLIMGKFKREDARNVRASGIDEEYNEKCQLLTDIVTEMKDRKRESKERKDAEAKKEEELKEAGERIREEAMNRVYLKRGGQEEYEHEGTSDFEQRAWKKPRKTSQRGASEGWEVLMRLEESRKETEEKRLELEKQKLEDSRDQRSLEREERLERMKLEKEEKKAMINLLQTLVKKME